MRVFLLLFVFLATHVQGGIGEQSAQRVSHVLRSGKTLWYGNRGLSSLAPFFLSHRMSIPEEAGARELGGVQREIHFGAKIPPLTQHDSGGGIFRFFSFQYDRGYRGRKNYSYEHFRPYIQLFGLGAAPGAAAMATQDESKKTLLRSKKEEFLKIISSEGYKKILDVEGKDIVLVIGNTGSGKSTTIAHLMGAEIEEKKDPKTGKKVVVVAKDEGLYPKIGHKGSQTLYPELFVSPQGTIFCDCPGWFDTRGEFTREFVRRALQYVAGKAKSRRFLVVTGHDELTALRGGGFKNIVKEIEEFFDISDASDSFTWVCTKAEGYTVDNILNTIEQQKEQIQEELKSRMSYVNTEGGGGSQERGFRENVQEFESVLEVCDSIKSDNLVLLNLKDTSSKYRLFVRLKDMEDIPASQIKVREENSGYNSVAECERSFMADGLVLYWKLFEKCSREKVVSQAIRDEGRKLSALEGKVSKTRDSLKSVIREAVGEAKKTEKQWEYKQSSANVRIRNLLDNATETLLFPPIEFSQARKRLGPFKIFFRSEKIFEGKDTPFTKIEKSCAPGGRFVLDDTNPGRGFYKIHYKGAWGAPGSCTIKVFGKKNSQPNVLEFLHALENESEVETRLLAQAKTIRETLEKDLENVERVDAGEVKERIQRYRKEQQVLENEVQELFKKFELHRGAYQSIYKIRSYFIPDEEFTQYFGQVLNSAQ